MFLFGKTKKENKKLKKENLFLKKENSYLKKRMDKVASDGLRHGSSEGGKHLAGKRRK
ncbi:hypothetical protein [Streptococcus sp.]